MEALSKWVGHIPADVVKDMASVAPMLSLLGYDPNANPPDYGKPDAFVMSKMQEIYKNEVEWKEKEKEFQRIRDSIRNDLMQQRTSKSSHEEQENDIGQSSDDHLSKANDKDSINS